MKLERLMLDDLIYVEYKGYGNLDNKKELCLKNKGPQIISDYKKAEEEGVSLYYPIEVRTQMLKDNLIIDESLDVYSFIYRDVDLESIAEVLADVTIEHLEEQLSRHGNWQVHLRDGLHLLVDFS